MVTAGAQHDAKTFFDHAAVVVGVLLSVDGAAGPSVGSSCAGTAQPVKAAPLFVIAVGSLDAFLPPAQTLANGVGS